MKTIRGPFVYLLACTILLAAGLPMEAAGQALDGEIYPMENLPATDSELKVEVGDKAPGFRLPAVSGETIGLKRYLGNQNVVLSFVPAAWTPVCSDQWPGYNITKNLFAEHNAVLLGITVDNIPTLYAWTRGMGELWFPVLSDFWPHGAAAESYGVLRSDGMAERALFFIDTRGVIRDIRVSDINTRPALEEVAASLKKLDPE
jgi:peroxiredoxin (alkyl hydroperoxide reductase subunit C)